MKTRLPIIEDIEAFLQEVGQDDLARAERSLSPLEKEEAILGVIDSVEAQKIWALAFLYAGKSVEFKHKSSFEALDDNQAKEWSVEAARYHELCELIRDIFWAQCRLMTGSWDEEEIGIRTGYQLVRLKPSRKMPPGLARIFGAAIQPEE